jgi:peptidylprolyl isomerase
MYGSGQLFPALEDRIGDMAVGETREVRIPPEDAYGPWESDLVRSMPRSRLPPDLDLEVGGNYRIKANDGRLLRFRLVEMGLDVVTADFNPLHAGKALLATVTVVAVRAATPAEERRGRV